MQTITHDYTEIYQILLHLQFQVRLFREIINETQFATSNDQTRAISTGVRFIL